MGVLIGVVLFAILLPAIMGLMGIIIPLVLAVITLPLQLLGVMAEEETK